MGSPAGSCVFFCFFETFNRGGHPNVPAAGNRLTAAGKAARHGKATIYRDLLTLADAFAHCAKANLPAAENVSVVAKGPFLDCSHLLYTRTVLALLHGVGLAAL